MHDLVILYSGGADSRLMLEMALEDGYKPYCVLIDYEQLHIEELDMAKKQLEGMKIDYRVVKIHGLGIDSGLTGNGTKLDRDDTHEMHVASRNMMFVGVAASIAESKRIKKIWVGFDKSDVINKFPDCMPEWVHYMSRVLEINGPEEIVLQAPLADMTKEEILSMLNIKYDIKEKHLFSGYGSVL